MRISDWSQTCALPIWRLEQAGKERRLVKRDARCRLAEVVARRCIDTISAGAEVDPVEVDGEDLVLGEAVLQPERQHDLLDLALQSAIRAEEEVLGKLLGEGGAALGDAAFAQVHVNRTKQAALVDAAVLVEAAVRHRHPPPRRTE